LERLAIAGTAGLCLLGQAAAASAATIRCVNSTRSDCQITHASIGAAVAAASASDIIFVGAGTYNETVMVDKQLTFLGAQAGRDARGRPGGATESVVNATALGPLNAGFLVTATGVVIDGFTVQGATDGAANGGGIDLKGGASPASGARILNNIIQNNAVGLYLNFEGFAPVTGVVIQRNQFRNNTVMSVGFGDGIFTSACADVTVADNTFTGHITAALGFNNSSFVKITGNQSTGDATFVIFTGTTNSSFSHNRGSGFTAQPTSTGNGGAAVAIGPNNAYLEISSNDLTNGATRGIRVTSLFGTGVNHHIGIRSNQVRSMVMTGISVESDMLTLSTIEANASSSNGGDEFFVDTGNSDNVLITNTARVTTAFGTTTGTCRDNSVGTGTAGTANFWFDNLGTGTPPGICN
jgi:hypothetical protein